MHYALSNDTHDENVLEHWTKATRECQRSSGKYRGGQRFHGRLAKMGVDEVGSMGNEAPEERNLSPIVVIDAESKLIEPYEESIDTDN